MRTALHRTADGPAHDRAGRWVLLSSILAVGMTFIDATALSVALPVVQSDLAATGADLMWIINAFTIPVAALLLLGGGLGDWLGRKQVLLAGIVIFAMGSIACASAPGISSLIAARIIQGIGAALMIPGSLALVASFFDASERGKAIGTWSAFSVVATGIGPVVGGLLAHAGLWRGVFLVNLPLAVIACIALLWKVPPLTHARAEGRLDFVGALLVALGLAGINVGLIALPERGLGNPMVATALGGGLLSLLAFIFHERKTRHPLLPPGLFRSRTLTAACLITLTVYTAFYGLLFFLPLNLIHVQGYDPALAGVAQLPLLLLLILLSRPAGGFVDRIGPRLPLIVGPLTVGLGFLLLSWPGITDGPGAFWTTYLPGLLVLGAGLGMTAAPLSITIMASVPGDRQALAAAINSTAARLAGVAAIALLGPVALITFQQSLDGRVTPLNLPAEVQSQLIAESPRLAQTRVPETLDSATTDAVRSGIQLAFIDMFRVVSLLAAGLSGLGAIMAARWIRTSRPG
jgi:EmrB/QacA subfamily drug resistance transporter